jgi:hypothetical protein
MLQLLIHQLTTNADKTILNYMYESIVVQIP